MWDYTNQVHDQDSQYRTEAYHNPDMKIAIKYAKKNKDAIVRINNIRNKLLNEHIIDRATYDLIIKDLKGIDGSYDGTLIYKHLQALLDQKQGTDRKQVVKPVTKQATVVKDQVSPLEQSLLQRYYKVEDEQILPVPLKNGDSARPTLPKGLLKLVKARWLSVFGHQLTDDQVAEIQNMSDRNVVMILILNELSKSEANVVARDQLLNVGEAYLSHRRSNRYFKQRKVGDSSHWATLERAIYEGLQDEANRDQTSVSDVVVNLQSMVRKMQQQLNEVHLNTIEADRLGVVSLLSALSLLPNEIQQVLDPEDLDSLDYQRLARLYNYDGNLTLDRVFKQQAYRDQQSNKHNGYNYR